MAAQPLGSIRDYFGSAIAFYFAYVGTYTYYLIALAVLGVTTQIYVWWVGDPAAAGIAFAMVACMWAAGFLKAWK